MNTQILHSINAFGLVIEIAKIATGVSVALFDADVLADGGSKAEASLAEIYGIVVFSFAKFGDEAEAEAVAYVDTKIRESEAA